MAKEGRFSVPSVQKCKMFMTAINKIKKTKTPIMPIPVIKSACAIFPPFLMDFTLTGQNKVPSVNLQAFSFKSEKLNYPSLKGEKNGEEKEENVIFFA